jgi:secondary thiamine-phosphate synthase enzyme
VNIFNIKTTKHKEIVDITDEIEKYLSSQKVESGLINVFVKHTTCALTTADLDPGTDLDMLDAFEEIVPKLKYRHPHDPSHTPEHIINTILGASVIVPFENKKLLLGTWQRVILVESSGPREREIVLNTISLEY